MIVALGLLPTVGSCEWPPNFTEYREHFEGNTNTLELLSRKLASSRFSSVTVFGDDRAEGWFEGADGIRQEFLESNNEWRRLLDEAKLHSIGTCGLGICASFGNDPFSGSKQGYFFYVRLLSSTPELAVCEKDDEDRQTGQCAIQLNDVWWATYGWRGYNR